MYSFLYLKRGVSVASRRVQGLLSECGIASSLYLAGYAVISFMFSISAIL